MLLDLYYPKLPLFYDTFPSSTKLYGISREEIGTKIIDHVGIYMEFELYADTIEINMSNLEIGLKGPRRNERKISFSLFGVLKEDNETGLYYFI